MKNGTTDSNEKEQNLNIEKLLRTNGYLFPETVDEVDEYERKFGNTNIILPDDMQTPSFLEKAISRLSQKDLNKIKKANENFAIAARSEKGTELPEHIKKQMEADRNNKSGFRKI